jgi:predicted site-specific integrase-resolvase
VLVSDIVILLSKLIQFQQNLCLLATSRSPSLRSEAFMTTIRAAFYARVSSEQQAAAHTIESQTAALSERAQSDGTPVPPERQFVDDGYSGATLIRPALDRLRDLATVGAVDRVYVHSPDRLARNYAYQVLLLDEWRRCGVELVFLNRPLGQSPEDDLLLQVQGIVAEYERAKIIGAEPTRQKACGTERIAQRDVQRSLRIPLCHRSGRRRSCPIRTSG